jgi:RimJ/RimL family protein N-acetyltransferase
MTLGRERPMLVGERVVLRSPEEEDGAAYHRWANDPEVTHTLETRYPTSVAFFESALADPPDPDGRVLTFSIENAEGELIGRIGLAAIDRDNGHAELGIVIGEPDAWGKGYGAEATRLMLRFAFEEMRLEKVYLGVLEYNERALKMYAACGFRRDGCRRRHYFHRGRHWDVYELSILRDEFATTGSS